MDSGMSSAETLPRISSDEDLSQDSISFSDEKVIDEVYITDHKQNYNKKKVITVLLAALSLSLTAIVPTVMLLSSENTSVYTGNIKFQNDNNFLKLYFLFRKINKITIQN